MISTTAGIELLIAAANSRCNPEALPGGTTTGSGTRAEPGSVLPFPTSAGGALCGRGPTKQKKSIKAITAPASAETVRKKIILILFIGKLLAVQMENSNSI